jgi:hypothetical protein
VEELAAVKARHAHASEQRFEFRALETREILAIGRDFGRHLEIDPVLMLSFPT